MSAIAFLKMVIVCIVLALLLIAGQHQPQSGQNTVPPTEYKFERLYLPDGTPCYVIRGDTHQGRFSVTCNYGG